jgi:hypothetical protein
MAGLVFIFLILPVSENDDASFVPSAHHESGGKIVVRMRRIASAWLKRDSDGCKQK